MAEKKVLDLPQTRGNFQVRGIVTGTNKEKWYDEKLTKTNKPWRTVSFGVKFTKDSTLYVGLNGMEQKEVYFSKRDKETKKTDVKKVPWKDRFNFSEEGYRMIGVNTGIERRLNTEGKSENVKKTLAPFDACLEVCNHLKDDVSVFVKGSLEFGSYNDAHTTKFVPNQISLAKDVDFDNEDYETLADFTQTIIFMGISANDDKTQFTVEAKIVNYNSIEDTAFIIYKNDLATLFRKNLKPYTSIKVWGNIEVTQDVEDVSTDNDCWGEANNMEKINTPTIRNLVITGADPTTIDTEIYSEEAINAALEQLKNNETAVTDFGGTTEGWGSVANSSDDSEDCGW